MSIHHLFYLRSVTVVEHEGAPNFATPERPWPGYHFWLDSARLIIEGFVLH